MKAFAVSSRRWVSQTTLRISTPMSSTTETYLFAMLLLRRLEKLWSVLKKVNYSSLRRTSIISLTTSNDFEVGAYHLVKHFSWVVRGFHLHSSSDFALLGIQRNRSIAMRLLRQTMSHYNPYEWNHVFNYCIETITTLATSLQCDLEWDSVDDILKQMRQGICYFLDDEIQRGPVRQGGADDH